MFYLVKKILLLLGLYEKDIDNRNFRIESDPHC
jgi:hypothetical protein